MTAGNLKKQSRDRSDIEWGRGGAAEGEGEGFDRKYLHIVVRTETYGSCVIKLIAHRMKCLTASL